MTKKISDTQLLQLGDVVARHLGLHFPKERWLDLQRAVCGAAEECGCQGDLDGYVLGLLALFAPGGVGVREVVLIGLLTPALGAGGAVALSVASRIVLTLTEVAAPLVVLLVTRGPRRA